MIDFPEQPSFSVMASLHFLEGGHYLFQMREEAKRVSKFVRASDVVAAFAGQEQDSGWLPAGLVRCGSNSKGDWFVYSAPAQKVELSFDISGEIVAARNVPIPRTVLVGAGSSYYLFALKTVHFDPEAVVFHSPFPNVDVGGANGNGYICWGSNKKPEVDMRKARAAWELFFQTPFSAHWANGKSQSEKADVGNLLRRLPEHKAKKFPLEDLVGLHRSIKAIVDEIVRS